MTQLVALVKISRPNPAAPAPGGWSAYNTRLDAAGNQLSSAGREITVAPGKVYDEPDGTTTASLVANKMARLATPAEITAGSGAI